MNWIFQGNPDYFDIDGYLRDFSIVNWTVKQKHLASEMSVGDRVFFWRASGKAKVPAGIVAVGEITSEPVVVAEDTEALKYWKVAGGDQEELRVYAKITNRLPYGAVYPKAAIAATTALEDLNILKFSNSTNYRITEAQANALASGFAEAIKAGGTRDVTAYSWTIESANSAYKVLDKSAFIHRGTGIPREIRSFFLDRDLALGESRPVTLVHQGKDYAAHLDMESQGLSRTRLFWNADFTALLKETFPHHYKLFSSNQEPDSQVALRFNRLSGFDQYEVSFAGEVSSKTLEHDIQSEELEERGPQKEGKAKEYFGKRYERSVINRQQAIKIHGLSCNVCGFNFEKTYGARGANYIEVHHIKPIHTYEEEQHVDPKTDLITLCSNCHRMVHRDPKKILGLQELIKLVAK